MDVLGFLLLFMGLHLVHTHSVSTSEEKIVICRPRDLASVFSEDPHIFHEGSCPTTPAPDEVPRNACHQCECWSDANCDEQEKCCYNGCKNTCVDSVIVAPAAVIDWLDEPPRQRTAGNAWLIPGPEEPYAGKLVILCVGTAFVAPYTLCFVSYFLVQRTGTSTKVVVAILVKFLRQYFPLSSPPGFEHPPNKSE
ncbi:putative WAP four-disulfide core domain protein 1 [Apostichopus japonicus]|uniref:Putative WAP four-disulfide core domain protein 1 n=1 Tax=Stichopus japonicus TaxID=307972 RepID=A0A2G8KSX9_STIJA|nr:putative WAP four-disulfide core domain protein 1 [Apostichopus japonicus]